MAAGLILIANLVVGLLLAFALVARRARVTLLELLAFAPALGFGWSSLWWFAVRWCGGSPSAPFARSLFGAVPLGLALAARPALVRAAAWPRTGAVRADAWLALGALAAALVTFVLFMQARPDGAWDAFAIWNVRARFLYRHHGSLRDLFATLTLGHPDYPLFLPGAIAAQFALAGGEAALTPGATAACFMLATGWLLSVSVRRFGGPAQAWLAPALLFTTPTFVAMSQAQMADVPVAYLFLASVASLAQEGGGERGLGALAGACLGLLAWTKNEGTVLAVTLLVLFAIVRLRAGRPPLPLPMLAALLSPALALIAFKCTWAPPNDLVAATTAGGVLEHLRDGHRWRVSTLAFLREPWAWPRWGASFAFLIGTSLIGLRSRVSHRSRALEFVTAALALAFAIDVIIYVITPKDQAGHIASSLDRLVLQLYPTIVALVFCRWPQPTSAPEVPDALEPQ